MIWSTARLKVGDRDMKASIPDGAAVDFAVELDAGPTRMQTWLEHEDLMRGAFFVDVERLP
jgi:hypothetical protein